MGTTKDIREAVQAELTFDPLVGVRNVKNEIDVTSDVDPVDVTGLVQVRDYLDVTG